MSLIVEPGCSKVRNIKSYEEFGSHFQLWERLFCSWPIFLGSLDAFLPSNGISLVSAFIYLEEEMWQGETQKSALKSDRHLARET